MPATDLPTVLRTLGDPTRLQVVEILSRGPRRAGELAARLNLPPPTMSKHLKLLLDAGIVDDERQPDDARVRMFRLRPDSVAAMRAWLDQLQAHWDAQLGSFKAHVERKATPR